MGVQTLVIEEFADNRTAKTLPTDDRSDSGAGDGRTVRFRCGACKKLLTARRGPSRSARCPTCKAKITVPTAPSVVPVGNAAARGPREPTIEIRPSSAAALSAAPPSPASSVHPPIGRVLGSEYLIE